VRFIVHNGHQTEFEDDRSWFSERRQNRIPISLA
jgi:hypothetical protein